MKPLTLPKWHISTLLTELRRLYDSQYAIVPLLNNTGVKVMTQWAYFTATFSLVSDSHVVVTLSPTCSTLDRQILTSAIIRAFRWEPLHKKPWCCGWLRRQPNNELHFLL